MGFSFETFGDAIDRTPGDGSNVSFEIANFRTSSFPQVTFDPLPAMLLDSLKPRDYSISTGNEELDSVLNSIVFMDSRNSLGAGQSLDSAGRIGVTLNNLVAGTDYQVQVIGGADDRTFASDPLVIDPEYMTSSTGKGVSPIGALLDEAGNRIDHIGGFLDLDEDGLGHVTTALGTFTADAESQYFEFLLSRGRNAGLSAIILSEAGDVSLSLDCNGDGIVSSDDLNCATTETIGSTLSEVGLLAGDFDLNGNVEFADFLILSANFGQSETSYTDGDVDANGSVEFADFLSLSANFGESSAIASTVPEPQSNCFLYAVAALALWSRRRQTRA